MIKLPNLGVVIIHSSRLVEQGGIMVLEITAFTGYSLDFKNNICTKIRKYEMGVEVDSYESTYIKELIPFWQFSNNTVVDFNGLEDLCDQLYVDQVHFNEMPFSGCSIEFQNGLLGSVAIYEEGALLRLVSWNKAGNLTEFCLGNSDYCYEYSRAWPVVGRPTLLFVCQDSYLKIYFDERVKERAISPEKKYTLIVIEKDPFKYMDELNETVGLKGALNKDVFESIVFDEYLSLTGSGISQEILLSLNKNKTWHNVKKIKIDQTSLSDDEIVSIKLAYPNIIINYEK